MAIRATFSLSYCHFQPLLPFLLTLILCYYRYRGDPQKLVKRALAEQNERFKDKMSGKEDMIYRQQ